MRKVLLSFAIGCVFLTASRAASACVTCSVAVETSDAVCVAEEVSPCSVRAVPRVLVVRPLCLGRPWLAYRRSVLGCRELRPLFPVSRRILRRAFCGPVCVHRLCH